ncbi:membrane protein [Microvirga vignae]|uniref:Membrane protein n=1 Tax=Microvirga vignae TaxID=1225564 RepID=A0A0H1R5C6_9HYPH|nr:hypothetical protein [Microvirga vignae]KLK90026.1 membrane protein [Microvirga vignae]
MTTEAIKNTAASADILNVEDERRIDFAHHALLLLVACILGLISNWVATKVDPMAALPGMALLYAISIVGLLLARFVPFYLPSVAWISLVAILATIPGVPGSAFIVEQVGKLNFLALATPALAYGGLALTQNEFHIARTSGWKIVIVAICVMFGTYMGSVVVADVTLKLFE